MHRRLAFARALALLTLVACDKNEVLDDDAPKKKPKPKPTVTASATASVDDDATGPCPKDRPKNDEPCIKPKLGTCSYADHQVCTCTSAKVWACERELPVKGPLPPPDLVA